MGLFTELDGRLKNIISEHALRGGTKSYDENTIGKDVTIIRNISLAAETYSNVLDQKVTPSTKNNADEAFQKALSESKEIKDAYLNDIFRRVEKLSEPRLYMFVISLAGLNVDEFLETSSLFQDNLSGPNLFPYSTLRF